jgi:AAA+ ATPase superfamily predicted ATPase
MAWGFYGRRSELIQLQTILTRGRWFFCKITGRRRIGKTTLIQEALKASERRDVLYVQIPDSGPAGILSAVSEALDVFGIDRTRFPHPTKLQDLAKLVASMARAGYVVALDEFQYFHRKHIKDFCSYLQADVDRLARDAAGVPGGLVVLGSLHTEMAAILEDRDAPLYNRVTDEIEVSHLDIASVCEILRAHAQLDPERLLFFWALFEGVPKFYRDCFEQGVLAASRADVLRRMFFDSSSPLRTEADNWFLHEFRGRYDVVLKFVARNAGCDHARITEHVATTSGEDGGQVGGYLKVLIERYRVIEKRLPIFAKAKTPKGRYYLSDNFLRTWLAALAGPVAAINFRPIPELVAEADRRMADVEGHSLEDLAAELYAERSRKGLPGFPLSGRIEGYWNSRDTEIDLVALDEPGRRIRFGFCRRSAVRLTSDLTAAEHHVARFLAAHPKYSAWTKELVGIAPVVPEPTRTALRARGWLAEDIADLIKGLLPAPEPPDLFA